ncbi:MULTISPECIES: hypothetical protein [Burkholderia]|uniref:hypothetical protein n=1 Tax=Burkholderia TaxID=32008 RepID=UPI0015C67E74|nr:MULTISPECIES: hypothetical protein [Burkholderia]MBY4725716.1 hypothetical protein [Burkholderia contaminans]MCI3969254.1 hypothetical protein [Burkholderia sp. HI4860]
MNEKTYGGLTLAEIKEALKHCDDAGIGIDDYFMDGAVGCNIVEDLVARLEDCHQ